MDAERQAKRAWVGWALALSIWTGFAVVLTGQAYLVLHSHSAASSDLPKTNPNPPLAEMFLSHLVVCIVWACLSMAIFWLGRRFPFGQGRWLRSLLVHMGASFVFAMVETMLAVWSSEYIRHDIPKPTITPNVLFFFFVAKVNNNLFFYWAILAVSHVVDYYRRWRDRELRSSQLEAQLAQAQLQVLKMQLHPHFLFNTLNAISALIHRDVDLADRMIACLGDLLRATLDNANQQEVTLKRELDFIEPYLEIEKARFGSRLTVRMNIEPTVMDAKVPNLILQPLVENAIRHGIAPRAEPGTIEIDAHRDNGSLLLSVTDDGPGLQAKDSAVGIGLANTRARLERLYGGNQRLELTNGRQHGLRVGITIPFQEMAVSSAEAS